ncbi:MAG: hypothetical protein AAF744_12635 [Pseudomonadota bacterium]
MPFKTFTFSILSALGLATAAQASVLYDCRMPGQAANSWVSPRIAMVFDTDGTVTVSDGIVLGVLGGPVEARASRNGDRIRVTWTVAGAKDNKGERIPKFSYEAQLSQSDNSLYVVAKPVGFPQRFSGRGTCNTRRP